jgi:hypothetical protein
LAARSGQKWRIDGEALLLDEPEWMPVARKARAQLRAHAAANAEAILARWGGPDAQHLTDEDLVEYETKAARQPASDATAVSSEEDEGAKENAGAARNKPAPPKAAKPSKKAAKAASKKREREAAASDEEEDDDFVREEAALKPKRKYVKKADKAEKEAPEAKPKKAKQEPFYKAVSAMVDLSLASSNPLQLLLIRLGLDAPGADGIDLVRHAAACNAPLRAIFGVLHVALRRCRF